MKRVVDFAADRTASNFIKKFRAGLLQDSLIEGKDKVLKQLVAQSEGSPSSKMKVGVVDFITVFFSWRVCNGFFANYIKISRNTIITAVQSIFVFS